jgi:hypothetical protein
MKGTSHSQGHDRSTEAKEQKPRILDIVICMMHDESMI